jgi:hypothetical protein
VGVAGGRGVCWVLRWRRRGRRGSMGFEVDFWRLRQRSFLFVA